MLSHMMEKKNNDFGNMKMKVTIKPKYKTAYTGIRLCLWNSEKAHMILCFPLSHAIQT